jgi:hypothetical protein
MARLDAARRDYAAGAAALLGAPSASGLLAAVQASLRDLPAGLPGQLYAAATLGAVMARAERPAPDARAAFALEFGPAALLLDAARRAAEEAEELYLEVAAWKDAPPPPLALPNVLGRLRPELLPPPPARGRAVRLSLLARPDGGAALELRVFEGDAVAARLAAARGAAGPLQLAAFRRVRAHLPAQHRRAAGAPPPAAQMALAAARALAAASGLRLHGARIALEAAQRHAAAELRPAWAEAAAARAVRGAGVAAEHAAARRTWRTARAAAQRERLAALRSDDTEAYLRLAEGGSGGAAVARLLAGTDACLRHLAARLEATPAGRRALAAVEPAAAAAAAGADEAAAASSAGAAAPPGGELAALRQSAEAWNRLPGSLAADVAAQPAALTGGALRGYQLAGLRWMVALRDAGLNGCLADEMGLGKTVQVVALAAHLVGDDPARYTGRPLLVAAPASVLPNWVAEFEAWAPALRVLAYRGDAAAREALYERELRPRRRRGGAAGAAPFHVLLTSYECLMGAADRPRLAAQPWAYVVVDEGHRLKNAGCRLVAALRSYRAERRLLLTGTPLQNNLAELWALLNFLEPELFESAADFDAWFGGAARAAPGGAAGAGAAAAASDDEDSGEAKHAALLGEEEALIVTSRLHQVLRPFVLRRLKEAVAGELPAKREVVLRCAPAPYQRALTALVERALAEPGASRGVANALMELRCIANHPLTARLHPAGAEAALPPHPLPSEVRLSGKLEVLDRCLLKLQAVGHRVLVFCTMTRPLDLVEALLEWRGMRSLRLDGATPAAERGALVAAFNAPPPGEEAFAFLLSMRAGGVGA